LLFSMHRLQLWSHNGVLPGIIPSFEASKPHIEGTGHDRERRLDLDDRRLRERDRDRHLDLDLERDLDFERRLADPRCFLLREREECRDELERDLDRARRFGRDSEEDRCF